MKAHERFEKFLSGIDLIAYRRKYKDIKIVELDMPKNIQALHHLYREYWDKRKNWPGFDNFYALYKKALFSELESFRERTGFSKETFYRGLPARIYRTWASVLTQIQGAYIAEEIYGKGKVKMGVNLDHSGKDIIFVLPQGRLPVQIKKISGRRDAQKPSKGKMIRVEYEVPSSGPFTPTGKPSKPYQDWNKKWGNRLTYLDNGFIIFKKEIFTTQKLLEGILEPEASSYAEGK